jgi:hypothetical protein
MPRWGATGRLSRCLTRMSSAWAWVAASLLMAGLALGSWSHSSLDRIVWSTGRTAVRREDVPSLPEMGIRRNSDRRSELGERKARRLLSGHCHRHCQPLRTSKRSISTHASWPRSAESVEQTSWLYTRSFNRVESVEGSQARSKGGRCQARRKPRNASEPCPIASNRGNPPLAIICLAEARARCFKFSSLSIWTSLFPLFRNLTHVSQPHTILSGGSQAGILLVFGS